MSNEDLCRCNRALTRGLLSSQGGSCPGCLRPFRIVGASELLGGENRTYVNAQETLGDYQNSPSEIEQTQVQDVEKITTGIQHFHLGPEGSQRARANQIKNLKLENGSRLAEPVYERVRSWSVGSGNLAGGQLQRVETRESLPRAFRDRITSESDNTQSTPGDRVNSTELTLHEQRLAFNMQDHDAPNRLGYQNLKLRPPRFEGRKGENVRHFVSRFEKYAAHQQVEPENYTDCLGLFLEGPALEFYDYAKRQDDGIDYENMKAEFIARFDDEQLRMITMNRLHSRKLKPSEKISEYYNDLLSISARIEIRDEDFLYIFINGLSPHIREQVICKGPATVSEAVQVAKTLEQVKSWGNAQPEAKSAYESIRAEIEKDKAGACAVSSERRELEEVKRSLQEIREVLTKLQDGKENDRKENADKGYSQFQAKAPWRQNGYQRFNNNRGAYRPQFRFGDGGGSTQQRGGYGPSRFPSNNFQNRYRPNSAAQQQGNWRRGGFGNNSGERNWRDNNKREGDSKQEANGAKAEDRGKPENEEKKTGSLSNKTGVNSVAEVERYLGDMILKASIGGLSVRCLLDTGSQLDIINNSVVQKLQGATQVEESEYTKIVAVNQSETHILGAIQKTIEITDL